MAGNISGGKKAAAKNIAREPGFYRRIGAIGGRNGTTGGFAANPELARIVGAKGGAISRRRKKDGTLPAAHLKAIHWYLIEHQYKPFAANSWPLFRFRDRDGQDHEVHIKDIRAEYDNFKKNNHNRRHVAA